MGCTKSAEKLLNSCTMILSGSFRRKRGSNMGTAVNPATFTVRVHTTRSRVLSEDKPQWKRCNWPKEPLRLREITSEVKSAKTRSWNKRKSLHSRNANLRDPGETGTARLQRSRKKRRESKRKRAASRIRIVDALNRWLASPRGKL